MSSSTVIRVNSDKRTQVQSERDIFSLGSDMGFGDIHFKVDPAVNLHAIVAIHNTHLGPALGGCRCVSYPSTQAAVLDATRLARSMSYKAAVMGLPYGGGKAVLMHPGNITNREAYFEAFGRFIDELGGRYITAVDLGTSVNDMDIIARCTKHVSSTSESRGGGGDPSPYTAIGVCRGIQAAVKHKLQRSDLENVQVLVQGAGHVGYHLVKQLHALDARISVCDIDIESAQRCADEFGCDIVQAQDVYTYPCDVFAPCAMGGVIDDDTVHGLQCSIVAGCANNQLVDARHGDTLHARGILYAPDYVVNAGGLVQVVGTDTVKIREKVLGIYDILLEIFSRSRKQNIAPARVADQMAEAILYGSELNEAV